MEFKGTKGEWYSIGNYIGVKNKKTRITHVTGSYPISDEEDSENARLMAHSKEMLKALQKIYQIENHAFGLKGFDVERLKAEIKTVLDKALQP